LKFCILTHVIHKKYQNHFYAYGPYVKEMNLWLNTGDKLVVVAPLSDNVKIDNIDIAYSYPNIQFIRIPQIEFTSVKKSIVSCLKIPLVLNGIFKGIVLSNHIHLRCPGNIGLIGSFVQILFPWKIKTAKYAGNWDPASPQPLTYKIQRLILSNVIFTKNIQVLVYGEWENQSKNIKPFFTATYWEKEIVDLKERNILEKLKLIYVGSLIPSKNPMLSAEIAKELIDLGKDVELNYFGEGSERQNLEKYIIKNNLQDKIFLHGNVNSSIIKQTYQESQFLIFISQSEGWPKVVAESMFWGCVPVTTKVSCVPWMLGNGERGYLVNENKDEIVALINHISQKDYIEKSQNAANWSRHYTLDKFGAELKMLVQ
jgi:glycosyltransferase involved in cell wall biosynthesis